jgi:hypothetical protein
LHQKYIPSKILCQKVGGLVAQLTAKSWAELEVLLTQKIASALEKTGKNTVERVAKEHVDSDVYRAYTPKVYETSFDLRESIHAGNAEIKGNEITVETKHNYDEIHSEAPNRHYSVVEDYSPRDVSEWIPYIVHEGKTFNLWNDDGAYLGRRPYMDNAREELEQSKEHVDDLVRNLRAEGLNAKRI